MNFLQDIQNYIDKDHSVLIYIYRILFININDESTYKKVISNKHLTLTRSRLLKIRCCNTLYHRISSIYYILPNDIVYFESERGYKDKRFIFFPQGRDTRYDYTDGDSVEAYIDACTVPPNVYHYVTSTSPIMKHRTNFKVTLGTPYYGTTYQNGLNIKAPYEVNHIQYSISFKIKEDIATTNDDFIMIGIVSNGNIIGSNYLVLNNENGIKNMYYLSYLCIDVIICSLS